MEASKLVLQDLATQRNLITEISWEECRFVSFFFVEMDVVAT